MSKQHSQEAWLHFVEAKRAFGALHEAMQDAKSKQDLQDLWRVMNGHILLTLMEIPE